MPDPEVFLEREPIAMLPGRWANLLAMKLANRGASRVVAPPWRWDRAWSSEGAVFKAVMLDRDRLLSSGLFWSIVALFFIVLGVAMFRGGGGLLVVPVMMLASCFVWAGVYSLGEFIRAGKFGPSRLKFVGFPFRRGGRFDAVLHSEGLKPGAVVKSTLRCIEERVVGFVDREQEAGGGSSLVAKERLERYQLHAEVVEGAYVSGAPGPGWRVSFEIPAGARPTRILDYPLTFWELEVLSAVPGMDYRAVFVVPVWGAEADSIDFSNPTKPS